MYIIVKTVKVHLEASLLLYLSSVLGGATVFPHLGVTVRPSPGSAVFWNNLYR